MSSKGGQGQDDRQTERSDLLEWIPFLAINNYSKFEINIFSKDRDTRKC